MKTKILILLTCLAATLQIWAKSEKKTDSYNYTRGVEAYEAEKYDEALDWFNREVTDNPDNPNAFIYIGILQEANEEYGRAITAYDNAMKAVPKKDKAARSMVMYYRSAVYIEIGDTVKAINELTEALSLDPTNYAGYRRRAEIYYMTHDYDQSDADGRKMIELDRGDVMGYMIVGRNAMEQQRWDDALKQFNLVVNLSPDYAGGYSFRAETYMGMEKWNEATDDLVKAISYGDEMAYNNGASLPDEAAKILKSKLKIQINKEPNESLWPYVIAMYAYIDNDWEEAIKWFEKANSVDAKAVHLEYIARSYYSLNLYNEALDYVEQAINMDPEDYDLVDLKADILSSLCRFEECLVERTRYISKYPESPYAYGMRAEELNSLKRYKDAIDDLNTAFVLNPELENMSYFLYRRAEAYRFDGQTEMAVNDYNKIIQLEKDSLMTTQSLSPYAYSGLGNIEKSIQSISQVLENDTVNNTNALYMAACVYARIGQKKEAVDFLRQAIDNGFNEYNHIQYDYDMDALRDMPEFKQLMKGHENEPTAETGISKNTAEYITEQVEVPFTKEGGVTKVKCSINGLPLHFIFDTGAATVSLSMVEANFMLKNDYIKSSDIVGASRFLDANGDITEGTIVNLRNVDFAGLQLENVQASVVRNQKAPLLLGQSVLGRLGKIEINNTEQKLVITHRVKK